ncbi:MAG: hypothetical protein GXX85_02985 [Ignavibacteria bacterium]|nr:hypothetical protein [Ignavibacteria bacterium]
MIHFYRLFFSLILGFSVLTVNGQILIKELSGISQKDVFRENTNTSSKRKIIELKSGWRAYLPEKPENKSSLSLPASFSGTEEIIFEREIDIKQFDFKKNTINLHISKISSSVNIQINDEIIFKHAFGEIPAEFELNENLFLKNKKNYIKLHVFFHSEKGASVPILKNYLLPEISGGVFDNVYLSVEPKFWIKNTVSNLRVNKNNNRTEIKTSIKAFFPETYDINKRSDVFTLSSALYNQSNQLIDSVKTILSHQEASASVLQSINNPNLWSPEQPYSYIQKISLFKNDTLIDRKIETLPLVNQNSESSKLIFNEGKLNIYAVTYIQPLFKKGNSSAYKNFINDLKIIKNAGFNTVIFSHSLPSPEILMGCEQIGLYAIIELPFISIPSEIISSDDFSEKTGRYISQVISGLQSNVIIGYSIGTGFLPYSQEHLDFVKNSAKIIKNRSGKVTFASFAGIPESKIENLDFICLEIFSKSFEGQIDRINDAIIKFGAENIIIGPYTYPTFNGSTNGYKNNNSYESQARNIENALDFVIEKKLNGIIFNSMFDYKIHYSSLAAGYNPQNLCYTGILGIDRKTNRLSYNIIKSKLKNGEKFNIPIGTDPNDSPLFFLIVCLVISSLAAMLINSKRKFREDASRALLRPYNFYADVRDQRILSGFHSNFLLVLIVGSLSLLFTNLLFYLKNNLFLDKTIISLGSISFTNFIGGLSISPVKAFIYLFIILLLFILSITLFIKIASMFLKNRVLISSIYFMTTWSFLPILLLLPLELALYKILKAHEYNTYIYIFLALFFLWIFQRLIKGIYVILDIHPAKAYFFSIVFIFLSWGFVILYFQMSEASIYYVINAFKQFALMQ